MDYIFYDTETTGTSTNFDQILQFGAIRTDEDFNELDRFEIRCHLLPWVVPNPGALLTTGVSPALLVDRNLSSHFDMVAEIEKKLLAWSPAVFIGYNSISFDENLLRQALFQTLRRPYLTNTHGNGRADALTMARACSVHAPNTLSIPIAANGRMVFKLDRLAPQNGFAHENAHDAMADVEATIHVAKIIKTQAPEVWAQMMMTSSKRGAANFLTSESFIHQTEFYAGLGHTWMVTKCGQDPTYDGRAATFDLSVDPAPYLDMSVDQLVSVLNASPKVIRTVRLNAQPILMPLNIGSEWLGVMDLDDALLMGRIEMIQNAKEFQERVGLALSRRYEERATSVYYEERIYDGFPNRADEGLMVDFHRVSTWPERLDIARQFNDERLKHFAFRAIYAEAAEVLSESHRKQIETWIADKVLDENPKRPWTNVSGARLALEEQRDSPLGKVGKPVLDEIESFLASVEERWRAARSDQLEE